MIREPVPAYCNPSFVISPMKTFAAILVFMCMTASAQVAHIELKETPPLTPLNWCKHADGITRSQIEPCGPGTTVGSSINTNQPNEGAAMGNAPAAQANGNSLAPTATPAPVVAAATPAVSDKEILKQARKSWMKLLGFALIVAVIAKVIGRSFWRWFFVGIILHIVLVAMNLLSF